MLIARNLLVFCLMLMAWQCHAQYTTAEGRILLSGEVKDEEGKALANVHIVNQFTREVTITDASGFFTTYISKHHILRFTSVGYEPYLLSIDRSFDRDILYQEIIMASRVYTLRGLTVEDSEEVIETVVRKPEPQRLADLGTLGGREPVPVAPTLLNPISLLYQTFGSKPRQQRMVAELQRLRYLDSVATARLSGPLVWEMTGLFGKELEAFKKYCALPPEFYVNASEYEFVATIRQYFIRFRNQGRVRQK